jgi:hypothetical protein
MVGRALDKRNICYTPPQATSPGWVVRSSAPSFNPPQPFEHRDRFKLGSEQWLEAVVDLFVK